MACFRDGFVEDIARARTEGEGALLDAPHALAAFTFVETVRPDTAALRSSMLQIRTALGRSDMDPLCGDALFTRLALGLLANERGTLARARRVPAVKPATRVELFRRVSRARDFIEAALGEELTLARIARAACLSPYHCHRLFCAVFAETPNAYVTRRRLERARALLAHGNASVLEVCLRVGFSSVGSFGTRYRLVFGVSPGTDRRAARARRGRA